MGQGRGKILFPFLQHYITMNSKFSFFFQLGLNVTAALKAGFQGMVSAELNLTISSQSMFPSASQKVPMNSAVNLLTTLAYSCTNSSFFFFA